MMKSICAVLLAALGASVATGVAAQSGFGAADVTAGDGVQGQDSFDVTGMTPEDQTPTGKFTTAAEVSQILDLTKGNWAAVREYNGQDIVYFSQILSWRCGLKAMKYSINEEPLKDLELPPCHMKFQQPNVLLDDEVLVGVHYFDLNSVKSVRVDLLLDNLAVQSVTLLRENIMIP